jgi:TonB family protein
LLSEAEGRESYHLDLSEWDAPAPHRAAIPIPPVMLTETLKPRRSFSLPYLAGALMLHGGFLVAAVLWGQGHALPPGDQAIAVELVYRIGIPPETRSESVPPDIVANAEDENAGIATTEPRDGPPRVEIAAVEAVSAREDVVQASARAWGASPPPFPPRGTLERLRQVLAASPSESEGALPPLPGRSPRTAKTSAAMTVTASASIAPFGRPQAVASASARRMAFAMYRLRVRSQIERSLPIGNRGPGRVAIGFRLSRSGQALSVFVLRSSGNIAIDRAALRCVRADGPYPPPPPGAASAQLALSMTFRFE